MNPRIKQQWIDALTSGNYQKTIGTLKRDDCFCAYGVLCDLYAKQTNASWYLIIGTSGAYSILKERWSLPDDVAKWADINPLSNISYAKKSDNISLMNDKGSSFTEIAEYIKQNF